MRGGLSRMSILPYSSNGAYPGSCRLSPNCSYWMRWRYKRLYGKKATTEFSVSTESEKRAWHYSRLANFVPPLRGLGLSVNMVPPLPRWATFLRPSGTDKTSERQAWNILVGVDHMQSVQALCST